MHSALSNGNEILHAAIGRICDGNAVIIGLRHGDFGRGVAGAPFVQVFRVVQSAEFELLAAAQEGVVAELKLGEVGNVHDDAVGFLTADVFQCERVVAFLGELSARLVRTIKPGQLGVVVAVDVNFGDVALADAVGFVEFIRRRVNHSYADGVVVRAASVFGSDPINAFVGYVDETVGFAGVPHVIGFDAVRAELDRVAFANGVVASELEVQRGVKPQFNGIVAAAA